MSQVHNPADISSPTSRASMNCGGDRNRECLDGWTAIETTPWSPYRLASSNAKTTFPFIFTLVVEFHPGALASCLPVFKGIKVQLAKQMQHGRGRHCLNMFLGTRFCRRDQGGEENLREVEMPEHVGAHLEIISVGGQLVGWASSRLRC